MPNILASAISNIQHLAAFDETAAERLDNFQLDRLLVYIIDTVDASALPWLAWQFDVLGYKGMRLAQTESQQREVIKTAIMLKRYAGTPWAVKNALRSIGYPDAVLVENAGVGLHGWAQFRIELNVGDNAISEEKISELIQMINIYKGTRNHLIELSYLVTFNDEVMVTDDHNLEPGLEQDELIYVGAQRFANGEYIADGSIDASLDSDSLTMIIDFV